MSLSRLIEQKLIYLYPEHLEWAFEEMTVGQLIEVLNELGD
jgi:hypothetical protein